METLFDYEPMIRLGCFIGVLLAMALFEAACPRRRVEIPRLLRWSNNLALVLVDTLVLRLVFPILAVGLAMLAAENGWGAMNQFGIPLVLAIVLAVIVLDFAIYLQHVMFHAVPAFWRLHRMHHSDPEIDVTTGLRFHPLEIILSMLIKLAVVMALGPPAAAVVIFEILLNASSLFNHSNVKLPLRMDAVLRWIVVTPDMHRVHHSIDPVETNSNFGFNLPWWDRLMGTYQARPRLGHTDMTIGIEAFRERRELWLDRLLVQPFKGPANICPINRPSGDSDEKRG